MLTAPILKGDAILEGDWQSLTKKLLKYAKNRDDKNVNSVQATKVEDPGYNEG
ncbi:hypothetical protein OsccyDRAFT_3989 [Leptolyngbyaceae cyanobacterium JSC-12]|nr:hypothetical protein OsccyDRAFT_3989 [Leptolyngbyaceae cyanobacterium JSC-12]